MSREVCSLDIGAPRPPLFTPEGAQVTPGPACYDLDTGRSHGAHGHASTRAASIYLHTTSERDLAVAAALDRFLPPKASGT